MTSPAKPARPSTQKRRKLPRKFYAGIGAEGGASATLAKVTAAKANGKLGGRPSKSVAIHVGNRTVCVKNRAAWRVWGLNRKYGADIETTPNEFGYHRIAGAWTPDDYESAKWVICGRCGDLRRITQRSAQEAHQRKCEGI